MNIVTIAILIGLGYGLVCIMKGVIRELAEIAAEAWHIGQAEK